MTPLKHICSLILPLAVFLTPMYVSAQDAHSSPASTSALPEEAGTSSSKETHELGGIERPFGLFSRLFRTLFQISLHDLAEIQRYLHRNISGFTTEACAVEENRGPCVYTYAYDAFINRNETCSIYTIGNCKNEIRR
ncbi:hypothetical protein B7P43_G07878 [Cryptotermes secundus]|uniref:Uncharacterized protein n=2 Tax=Cryptotermes secundus TaxID=105785 RepID=A0A2J7QJC3_9NEOP|nr:hypothetical protein B7P43_G07878 [Cryptotermes secundus]